MVTRHWFGVCAGALCAAVVMAQPPQSPGKPSTPTPPASSSHDPPPSDDEFIEFLGTDDVGDAAWWEFLKKSAPAKDPPQPSAPRQDANS
jgi:hypothetical protein